MSIMIAAFSQLRIFWFSLQFANTCTKFTMCDELNQLPHLTLQTDCRQPPMITVTHLARTQWNDRVSKCYVDEAYHQSHLQLSWCHLSWRVSSWMTGPRKCLSLCLPQFLSTPTPCSIGFRKIEKTYVVPSSPISSKRVQNLALQFRTRNNDWSREIRASNLQIWSI